MRWSTPPFNFAAVALSDVCFPAAVVQQLEQGLELAEVVALRCGGKDVRAGQGMMGVLTAGHLPRAECYEQGLIFAFAPWLSEDHWWS